MTTIDRFDFTYIILLQVAGETNTEVGLAGKKSIETVKGVKLEFYPLVIEVSVPIY